MFSHRFWRIKKMPIDETKPEDATAVSELPEYIRETREYINTIAERAGVNTTAPPTTPAP